MCCPALPCRVLKEKFDDIFAATKYTKVWRKVWGCEDECG